MKVFDAYATYYDILYKQKDYEGEVNYVLDLIKKFGGGKSGLLNMGCGSGKHDRWLAKKGWDVMGVDQSESMVKQAIAKCNEEGLRDKISYLQQDIRELDTGRSFDVVCALFHVMSYQNTNEDIRKVLAGVHLHLHDDGLFIFDYWYGPAVFNLRPEKREVRLEDNGMVVVRRTTPDWLTDVNVVKVNFDMDVFPANDEAAKQNIREVHAMRYFFLPELDDLLLFSGFKPEGHFAWMTGDKPTANTWNVVTVARKIKAEQAP